MSTRGRATDWNGTSLSGPAGRQITSRTFSGPFPAAAHGVRATFGRLRMNAWACWARAPAGSSFASWRNSHGRAAPTGLVAWTTMRVFVRALRTSRYRSRASPAPNMAVNSRSPISRMASSAEAARSLYTPHGQVKNSSRYHWTSRRSFGSKANANGTSATWVWPSARYSTRIRPG